MIRAALPRILALLAVVVGGTTAISLALGALSHKGLLRSLATGYYVIGAAVLVGSFVLGSRGPWRTEEIDDDGGAPVRFRRRRRRRRATPEERAEGKRSSLGLFVLGIGLVLLGAVVDPSRRAF